jgi:catechol 2,3-dioxygenase-like lactoylglutathione lyase family enzyme
MKMADTICAPPLGGVLETAIYVDDMTRARSFYLGVLGLAPLFQTERLTAFDAGRNSVLLVFARGASRADMSGVGGTIPGHDGSGPLHMAFAITADTYDDWKACLLRNDVSIRSEVRWDKGGRSIYFDDPDGHVVELATPGLWANY